MSGRRTTERDRRRRELGQNFLTDRRLLARIIGDLDVRPAELVVDLGAGAGAITRALLDVGAHVWAVEVDPEWVRRLRHRFEIARPTSDVRVIGTDLRNLRLPRVPYRVVANPPFGLTTDVLATLLDRPDRGPERADLIVQKEVARKLSRQPPATLRAAAWAPWWEFRLGPTVPRDSFRPRPGVDAAVLTIVRRDPPVLPTHLAPRLGEVLRPVWLDGPRSSPRHGRRG